MSSDDMSPASGQMYGSDGDIYWTADVLSGTTTAVAADNPANNMSPASGKIYGPAGDIHWMVDLMGAAGGSAAWGGITGTLSDQTDLQTELDSLETQINSIPTGLSYQGSWDASANTPTLADGSGTNGDMYKVSVAGTQDLGSGSIDFNVGDHVVYDGATWENFGSGLTSWGDIQGTLSNQTDLQTALDGKGGLGQSNTWTDSNIFTKVSGSTDPTVNLTSSNPQFQIQNTSADPDTGKYNWAVNGSGQLLLRALTDDGLNASNIFAVNRTAGTVDNITFNAEVKGLPIDRTSGTVQLQLNDSELIWPNAISDGKIRLWNTEASSDFQYYGFGIENGALVYQVDSNTSKHVFRGADQGTDSALPILEMSSDGGIVASVDTKVESADPKLELHRTGAAANEGRWLWSTDPDQLSLTAVSDDGNTVGTAWLLTRSGANITAHSIQAGGNPLLDLSAASDIVAHVDLHMSEKKIVNMANGTNARDGVNRQQLDEKLTADKVAHMSDSIATDTAGIVANFNALLQNMITAGVMASS